MWGEPVLESCSKATEAGENSDLTLFRSVGSRTWDDWPPPPPTPVPAPPTVPPTPELWAISRGSLRSSKPSLRIS